MSTCLGDFLCVCIVIYTDNYFIDIIIIIIVVFFIVDVIILFKIIISIIILKQVHIEQCRLATEALDI